MDHLKNYKLNYVLKDGAVRNNILPAVSEEEAIDRMQQNPDVKFVVGIKEVELRATTKVIKTFRRDDIQEVVNTLEQQDRSTELMRVRVFEDYDLEDDGVFRGCSTSEEFYKTTQPLSDNKALIKDLARNLIKISL